MARKGHSGLPSIRVDLTDDPATLALKTAREFDPDLTDLEIAAGLRALADEIELRARDGSS